MPAASAPVAARDLVELRDFGRVSISPDSKWVALILRRADAGRDTYCFGVVLVPLSDRGEPRFIDIGGEPIFMRGDIRGIADVVNGTIDDLPPVWSADGRSIAYLRRDRGVTQAWVAAIAGRGRALTRFADAARKVEWATPNILRVTIRPSREAEAAITQEGRSGYLYDRRFWVISETRPSPPPPPFKTVAIYAATGRMVSDPIKVSQADRPADAALFVRFPEGGIAWTAPLAPGRFGAPHALRVEYKSRVLDCGEVCSSRVAGLWVRDEGELVFLRGPSPENGGRTELYRWNVHGTAGPQLILATDDLLENCGLAGRRLICAHETSRHPRTLVAVDPASGAMTTLYDPNPEFRNYRLGGVERLRWTASDGVSSYGDLVLPPSHEIGQRHPLVIVQYTTSGFLRGGVGDEYPIHLFAMHGYAVLSVQRPRPPGRDSAAADLDDFQRINVTDWADRRRVLASLEAGIDAVLARGVAVPDRIGLTGLSDGGSTIQFALLNSTRFRAAVTSTCCEAAGVGLTAGLAYSDSTTKWGYPPPGIDDSAFWKPMSLAARAGQVRTPLLMQLADREYRLGVATFAALDHAGAPVEMYVFPDEYHVKVHPAHRLAIYHRNLAWFDFWLRDLVAKNPASARSIARWRALKIQAGQPTATTKH